MRTPKLLVSILALAAFAGCTSAPALDSGAAEATADQCNYFQQNGRTTICHATGSATHPFALIRVATQACVNAHADHASDHVAVDGDCGPDACLADNAPCDGTLDCCGDSTCEAGTCTPPPPPPPVGDCPCFTAADVVTDIQRTRGLGAEPQCNVCSPDAVIGTVGQSCYVRNGLGSDTAYLLDLIENSPFLGYRCTREEHTQGGGTKGFSADDARACAAAIIQAEAQAGLTCH